MVCVVNPKFLQKVALLTNGVEQSQQMASVRRQIFHAEIGRSLAKLREDKQLSQGQVALKAKGKLSEGTIKAIETGRIKNPDPDHLRALAAIYGVPFRVVAEPFVRANYGGDLTRQNGDQQSTLSLTEGAQAHDPAAARVEQQQREIERLTRLVEQFKEEAREVRSVSDALARVTLALEETRKAADGAPARRRRDRKVG